MLTRVLNPNDPNDADLLDMQDCTMDEINAFRRHCGLPEFKWTPDERDNVLAWAAQQREHADRIRARKLNQPSWLTRIINALWRK